MALVDRSAALRVGFLTVPNYSMIAFSNAVEPLRMANRLSGRTLCSWSVLSLSGAPVAASNGLAAVPTIAVGAADRHDIVFVCGGIDIRATCDEATLGYL